MNKAKALEAMFIVDDRVRVTFQRIAEERSDVMNDECPDGYGREFQQRRKGMDNTETSEALFIAGIVWATFQRIAEERADLMNVFHNVYAQRSRLQELSESMGNEGMVNVFASLLGLMPQQSQCTRVLLAGTTQSQSASINTDFLSTIRDALKKVAMKYPYVLITMEDNTKKRGPFFQLLCALLLLYSDKKDVYPYS